MSDQYFFCADSDGSFSWGRIVGENVVNTVRGKKDVFILEGRITCRIPKSDLERQSIKVSQNNEGIRVKRGSDGRVSESLPSYQSGLRNKLLSLKGEVEEPLPLLDSPREDASDLVVGGDISGHVSMSLSDPSQIPGDVSNSFSRGLSQDQKAGKMSDGTDFIMRRFGYLTVIWKEKVSCGGMVINRGDFDSDLTEDELLREVLAKVSSSNSNTKKLAEAITKSGARNYEKK